MGKLRLVLAARVPDDQFLFLGLIACTIFLLVPAPEARAEVNRPSAILRIQITIVPTVQTPVMNSQSTPPAGTVSYDLRSKSDPVLTQQTTIHALTGLDQSSASGNSNKAAGSSVLETLTIVAK